MKNIVAIADMYEFPMQASDVQDFATRTFIYEVRSTQCSMDSEEILATILQMCVGYWRINKIFWKKISLYFRDLKPLTVSIMKSCESF